LPRQTEAVEFVDAGQPESCRTCHEHTQDCSYAIERAILGDGVLCR